MNDEIQIRPAGPDDLDAVVDLLAVQMAEHAIDIARADLAYAVEGVVHDPGRGAILVAARDGSIVGVACLAHGWTIEHGGFVTWLDELYVVPAMRCHGVGTRLLEAAMETARELGCVAMDLEVDEGHRRVESLYLRHGFRPFPRRHFTKRLR